MKTFEEFVNETTTPSEVQVINVSEEIKVEVKNAKPAFVTANINRKGLITIKILTTGEEFNDKFKSAKDAAQFIFDSLNNSEAGFTTAYDVAAFNKWLTKLVSRI